MNFRRTIRDLLARRLGVPEIPGALQLLASNRFAPELVIDVGAYRGEFAQLVLKIWPGANVVCCEPLPHQFDKLQQMAAKDTRLTIVNSLIGAVERQGVVLHSAETASSVLEEHTPQNFPEVLCSMTTLDRLVAGQFPQKKVDFIKIDVQGYELAVLQGAEESLATASALLIECNLLDIHQGVPLAHEVISWLADRNWRVYDIAGLTRRPLDGSLWQIDLIFVPENSPLRADKRWGK